MSIKRRLVHISLTCPSLSIRTICEKDADPEASGQHDDRVREKRIK
jgi:hypothetical protein